MSLGLQYAPWARMPWTDGMTKPWDAFSKTAQTINPQQKEERLPGQAASAQPIVVAQNSTAKSTAITQVKSPWLKIHEGLGRQHRPFPKAQVTPLTQPLERIPKCAPSSYSALEIHGFYGLIDDGSDASGRVLIAHVPKWVKGYVLDIRQGERLPVNRVDGKGGGTLTVLSTGRHKYYSPGKRVTTCTVCVPEEQWALFMD